MKFSRLMVALAAVVLLAVACSQKHEQAAATSTAPFLTSLDSAKQMAAEKDQYVLLDFYTDW